MASVEDLIAELKALTPDQLERLGRTIRELIENSHAPRFSPTVISSSVLEQAIQNGWPRTLFTDVIGHIDEDFERQPEIPSEDRPAL